MTFVTFSTFMLQMMNNMGGDDFQPGLDGDDVRIIFVQTSFSHEIGIYHSMFYLIFFNHIFFFQDESADSDDESQLFPMYHYVLSHLLMGACDTESLIVFLPTFRNARLGIEGLILWKERKRLADKGNK